MDRNSERAEATRERIVRAARELVIEHGYDGVSTGQVLRLAGVSRGGLYHHFAGKHDLMAAVLEAVERDLTDRLALALADAPDPFTALETGVQWYLDECLAPTSCSASACMRAAGSSAGKRGARRSAPTGCRCSPPGSTPRSRPASSRTADPTALAHMILALLHEAGHDESRGGGPARRTRANRPGRGDHHRGTSSNLTRMEGTRRRRAQVSDRSRTRGYAIDEHTTAG